MNSQITCPHCQKKLNVPAQAAGRVAACPACQGKIQFAAQTSPQVPQATPQPTPQPYLMATLSDSPLQSAGQTYPAQFQPYGQAYPAQFPPYGSPATPPQFGSPWSGGPHPATAGSALPWVIGIGGVLGVVVLGATIGLVIVLANNRESPKTASNTDGPAPATSSNPVPGNSAPPKIAPGGNLPPANAPGGNVPVGTPPGNNPYGGNGPGNYVAPPSVIPGPNAPSEYSAPSTPSNSPFGKDSEIPPEFAYLPDNVQIAIHANWDQLADSSLYRDLEKQLIQMAPAAIRGEIAAKVEEMSKAADTLVFGVTVPAGYSATGPEFSGALSTKQDVDLNVWFPATTGTLRRESFRGYSLIVTTTDQNTEVAFCQVEPRIILFGSLPTVRNLLTKGNRQPTLPDRLRTAVEQADFKRDLTLVVTFTNAQSGLFEQRPASDDALPSLIAYADIDSDITLDARLMCADAAMAQVMQSVVQDFLRQAQGSITDPQMRSALGSVRVAVTGSTVTAAMVISGRVLTNALNSLPSPASPALNPPQPPDFGRQ